MKRAGLFSTVFTACALLTACGGGSGTPPSANSLALVDTTAGLVELAPEAQKILGPENPVGIGLYNLSYYDQSFAMADVVRHSQLRGLDWSEDVGADSDGHPTRDFIMIFSAKVIGAGTYKLKFKGQAQVSLAAVGGSIIANKKYDAATNTTTADMILTADSTGNNWLTFNSTRRTPNSSAADGVTDLQLWRPGYPTDGSELFTREFVTAMRKFHVIRTMDFVSANRNGTQAWSERTRPNYPAFTGDKGQSWELMVMLANATGRDLWITVPVKADDTYIRKLAQLIRYGSDGNEPYTSEQSNPKYPPLKAGVKVYLEYGNEIWNPGSGFYGFGWALALANQYRENTNHPIAYDGPVADQYEALRRWVAYRSAFISLTFRQVFGDSQMMTRVRPIFAAQINDGQAYMSGGLTWAEGYHGDVTQLWYGGGGAAYYDSTTAPSNTLPETMQGYFDGLPSASFAAGIAVDSVITKGYGLKTVAYEGGPGPGGAANGTISGTQEQAYTFNNDPRMKDRMVAAHNIWLQHGGDLLVYYVYSAAAPWSFSNGLLMATASDTTSVKLQAIDIIRQATPPAPTLGTAVPGTVYLRAPDNKIITRINGGTAWAYNGTAYRLVPHASIPAKSEFVLVPVRTSEAGTYKISLATYDAKATDKAEIFVSGKLAGEVTGTPGTVGQTTATTEVSADLPAGISVIRIRAKAGTGLWVKDLIVSRGMN
jgi:hypothetical protein